ncbi:hypothetical protein AAC387_Pa05g0510 [Persea americana]
MNQALFRTLSIFRISINKKSPKRGGKGKKKLERKIEIYCHLEMRKMEQMEINVLGFFAPEALDGGSSRK